MNNTQITAICLTLVLILGFCFIRIFSKINSKVESNMRIAKEIKKLSKVRTYIFARVHDTIHPELNIWFDPVRFNNENPHFTTDEIKMISEGLFKKFCGYDDFIFVEYGQWVIVRLPYGATISFGNGSLDCYDRPYTFKTPNRDNVNVIVLKETSISDHSKILRTVRKL